MTDTSMEIVMARAIQLERERDVERAVSDKLLEALKEAAESLRGYDCLSVAEQCEQTIAEVEAMRKGDKG